MQGSDDSMATLVGTTVYETPRRLYNPVTEEFERIDKLSEDGYKRRFLAALYSSETTNTIDLDSYPVAHFDGAKWVLRKQEGDYILTKRDAETRVDEMALNDDTDGEQ